MKKVNITEKTASVLTRKGFPRTLNFYSLTKMLIQFPRLMVKLRKRIFFQLRVIVATGILDDLELFRFSTF